MLKISICIGFLDFFSSIYLGQQRNEYLDCQKIIEHTRYLTFLHFSCSSFFHVTL